ncbi:MAG TPA: hypothetical protein VEY69_18790 [Lautropia sp.]|nr:hypothetical protein [Lautropia sp.]
MFETIADQADGLRRHFLPRPPSVVPMGCCAPAAQCRGYAATFIERLEQDGFTPILFDRLDLASELGDVQTHAPVDRLVLLEEPVRLSGWLRGRVPAMLLLLSHHPDALMPSYATIKSIVRMHGLRRFATCFVDSPTVEHAVRAHQRLASCAHRFLDIEIEPFAPGEPERNAVTGRPCPPDTQRFEVGMEGHSSLGHSTPSGAVQLSH